MIEIAHILLVEDDGAAALLIEQYVRRLSDCHHLTTFSNAAQALSWIREHRIDLFILDIQLPDYRGTELGKQIRSIPEYRFTPILFTTELAGEELLAYREIKCYDFLVKPFGEEQFRQAFSAALEMGRHIEARPTVLRIEQKQFVFEYDLKNILYAESFGKQVVIHTIAAGQELSDRISGYSLARLLELAGPSHLKQCHKSYLINPSRLIRIDKAQRLLWLRDCGEAIPIGEKYQHDLREAMV